MQKIPTLFIRDFEHDHGRYVTDQVSPGCEWVLTGEGVPTRKSEGTCCMFDGERWWARRELKDGHNETPTGWVLVAHDEVTGKSVGWEPVENSGFVRWHTEAVAGGSDFEPGTYELIGPKVNGNPEGWDNHPLIRHGSVVVASPHPVTFVALRDMLTSEFRFEGIVWHHPDGRTAKLKTRDFPM